MGMASAASSVIDPAAHSSVPEEVMLIEYSRSDAEFETCLATEPSLRACLDKLHRAGHSVFREATDPKLYVEPDFVRPIIDRLTKEGVLLNGVRVLWQGLKCRHVIASEAYYPVVQSAIANLRKKCKVRVKSEVHTFPMRLQLQEACIRSRTPSPYLHYAYVKEKMASKTKDKDTLKVLKRP